MFALETGPPLVEQHFTAGAIGTRQTIRTPEM